MPPSDPPRPGTDERVQLVQEDDQLIGMSTNLVEHLLDALLEVAAIASPGDESSQIELHDSLTLQRLRHVALDDALRDAFDDGGLADAGLSDQHRVVLRAPREHLNRLFDLLLPADQGLEPAIAGERGQVVPVLIQCGGLTSPCAGPGTGTGVRLFGLLQRLRRDAAFANIRPAGDSGLLDSAISRCSGPM